MFGLQPEAAEPLIIAGPCSAETEGQTLETARALSQSGIKVFRAGVWKPRTKPGGFEGRGREALRWLQLVKQETGMRTITEVANRHHLDEAVEYGMDGVWIGARTSASPFAVQEIADAMGALPTAIKEKLTILVKNPVNPDIDLWIGAIERIYGSGVRRIGAIHRGFSSYRKNIYRNPPRWALAIEMKRRIPGLPLLFDPSHVAGKSELVEELARKAIYMNYDGLIIETHIRPECALSDATQQLTPGQLSRLLESIEHRTHKMTNDELEELRGKIDSVDDNLLELLARRMEISREIGEYKRKHRIPVLQMERYNDLMDRRVEEGKEMGLTPEFVRHLLALIHEESVKIQTK